MISLVLFPKPRSHARITQHTVYIEYGLLPSFYFVRNNAVSFLEEKRRGRVGITDHVIQLDRLL